MVLATVDLDVVNVPDPLFHLLRLGELLSPSAAVGAFTVESVCSPPSSTCKSVKGNGVIVGVSRGIASPNASVMESDFTAVSPAFLGYNPLVFMGGFNMLSFGVSIGPGIPGKPSSIAGFLAGFGRGGLNDDANSWLNFGYGANLVSGFTLVFRL